MAREIQDIHVYPRITGNANVSVTNVKAEYTGENLKDMSISMDIDAHCESATFWKWVTFISIAAASIVVGMSMAQKQSPKPTVAHNNNPVEGDK